MYRLFDRLRLGAASWSTSAGLQPTLALRPSLNEARQISLETLQRPGPVDAGAAANRTRCASRFRTPDSRRECWVPDSGDVATDIPFAVIDKAIADGKVIPFLGAGASMERRQPDERWSFETNERFGPLGQELAEWLADRVAFPVSERNGDLDLARVAQFADSKVGRELLRDNLRSVFQPSPQYSAVHEYLSSFDNPLLVITTNYDDMIEAAMESRGRPNHLVVHTIGQDRSTTMQVRRAGSDVVKQVNEIDFDLSTTTIYKLHGSCGPEGIDDYLISEDDYLRFLGRMVAGSAIPRKFAEPMKTRRFLFIGYGLSDWNLRLLLHQLNAYMSRPTNFLRSWAIMPNAGEVDRRLWDDRGVEVINSSLTGLVAGLVAARDARLATPQR